MPELSLFRTRDWQTQKRSESEKKRIDLADLVRLLHFREDAIDDEETELGTDWREKKRKKQEETVKFLRELFEKKERFKAVLKTEYGSMYFVTEDGQSLRFKKENGSYKDQPVMGKIIFISPEERKRLFETINSPLFPEGLINYKFKKFEVSEGMTPVEFGVLGMQKISFRETENELEILGTETEKGVEPFFASGVHVGHPISEIIKK